MTASSPLRRGAVSALDVLGRLTERDRLICRMLWEHRLLTTEQVCDLCFTSLVSTQHRLVTLWRLGVLDRFRSIRPVGSESWRYTLGPLGAAVVAAERGVDPPRASVLRDRVVALAAGQRTAHTLGVNGFFCALHAAARSRPDAAVGAWWSERRCAAEWGDFVRPDAYGVWEEARRPGRVLRRARHRHRDPRPGRGQAGGLPRPRRGRGRRPAGAVLAGPTRTGAGAAPRRSKGPPCPSRPPPPAPAVPPMRCGSRWARRRPGAGSSSWPRWPRCRADDQQPPPGHQSRRRT